MPGLPTRAGPQPTLGILALFKDEAQVLLEWLLHHSLEGVSQFVLLDQESSDNSSSVALRFAASAPHVRLDVVPVRRHGPWNNQVDHYNRHFHRLSTDWAMVIDCDEYAYARRGYATIPEFLVTLPDTAKLVGLVWKLFGSNGHVRQPRSIIASFTRRFKANATEGGWELANGPGSRLQIKSIFRVDAVRASGIRAANGSCCEWIQHQHRARFGWQLYLPNGRPAGRHDDRKWVRGPLQSMDDWALHFNHYQDRSCEYFMRVKMVRGSVINGESDKMHNLDYYRHMESHTNAWADDELARKRGADWPSRLLRPRERPWPAEVHVRQYAAYARLAGDALEAECRKHMWNASHAHTPAHR